MEHRGRSFRGVFDVNFWKKVPFQLDELVVDINQPPSSFIAHFLETQIKSLKKLSISGGFDLICLEVIFRMRELQKLEILSYDEAAWILDWNELALPPNNSIKSLDLFDLGENRDYILEAFIRSLRNIKHLGIRILNDRIFSFLSSNLRSLESRVSATRVLAGNSLPNLEEIGATFHNFTEEELKQLRNTPTNQNKTQALLRGRLQYMRYEDDEIE